MPLNVMVLESEPNAGADAARELRAAGHTVLSCHEEGAPAFPCRGVSDAGDCPLSSHTVDVALVVRPHTRAQPTLHEDGARCALMHRVPLVVAGSRTLSPYEGLSAREIDSTADVVAEVETAANAPIAALAERATAAIGATIGEVPAGRPQPRAEVTRRAGRLQVHVVDGGPMTTDERNRAAVAILAALRDVDRYAAGIDVAIGGTEAGS